jgi:hypothetical protein
MNGHRQPTPYTLTTEWQTQVDVGLETGRPPLFDLGAATTLLESLSAVVLLQAFGDGRLKRHPHDLTPTVLTGGHPALWLMALWHGRPAAAPHQPALYVMYSGGDMATHVASVATQSANAARLPTTTAETLPQGYAALLAPLAHAGVTLWEAWPFAVRQPDRRGNDHTGEERWLTWSALGLVLALLVLALLV